MFRICMTYNFDNIVNDIRFMYNLKNNNVIPNYKYVSFNISNLYTNIPVKEIIDLIETHLD